jgi:hypothetical protein
VSMFLREGKQREMGLGSASEGGVSLGTAKLVGLARPRAQRAVQCASQ